MHADESVRGGTGEQGRPGWQRCGHSHLPWHARWALEVKIEGVVVAQSPKTAVSKAPEATGGYARGPTSAAKRCCNARYNSRQCATVLQGPLVGVLQDTPAAELAALPPAATSQSPASLVYLTDNCCLARSSCMNSSLHAVTVTLRGTSPPFRHASLAEG